MVRVCAILEIELPDAVADPPATVDAAIERRAAVMASLPGSVRRVVAVTNVETMRFILEAAEHAYAAIGAPFVRAPAGYVPPEDQH
jgi:hypothetical protein